ncbi:MAG: putative DsbA family dithiol-disulfide isomerase [Candidatus Promineifilaceae bacterium]|jgi:predicted DsbA family dithiol-disulfide isomerase
MLRPPSAGPLPAEYQAKILAGRPRMAEMAQRDFGVEINFGTFSGTSVPALIGAKYAESQGKGEEYHKKIMSAYWVETKNIHDLAVLGHIAEEIGLDQVAFLESLESEPWTTQVTEDIDQAFQFGIQGVPGMVFNDKYYISGAQTHDGLVDLVRQVVEQG